MLYLEQVFKLEVATKAVPEIEGSNPHLNSCSKCIHAKTCGAFEAFSGVLNEMEKKYDFIKKPFSAESLAVGCSEFSPLILENGETAKIESGI